MEVLAGSAPPLLFQSDHACNTQTANRAFVLGEGGYEVSLCDLVDSKLDVVLDVDNAQITGDTATSRCGGVRS